MNWDRHDMPDCEHVAIRDDMDMICTHCGIILSLLDRPKEAPWTDLVKQFAEDSDAHYVSVEFSQQLYNLAEDKWQERLLANRFGTQVPDDDELLDLFVEANPPVEVELDGQTSLDDLMECRPWSGPHLHLTSVSNPARMIPVGSLMDVAPHPGLSNPARERPQHPVWNPGSRPERERQ